MAGHHVSTLPETGALYKLRFALRKDRMEMYLDTSGDGLHKRGYRRNATLAPSRRRWPQPSPTWAACGGTASCRTPSAVPARW